ncbi:hypothetical protein [Mycobacteroides chelonae]|uniref:hypothetical protein n=1 Tax=Mycobacteroides chelonae TaxID=1774 RepID=UPI001F1F4E76|nr:hypothetical protein [Mycobacteroides chelonae]
MPEVPGVNPVLAGACEDPGVLVAVLVGSWWPVAALDTAVTMDSAAAGRPGSVMDGMRGKTGVFESWWVSLGWLPCCWPAGVPDEARLGDLALGDAGVPDEPLPEMSPASVGFTGCGVTVELGAPGALGDSGVDGVLARGISGSFCGVTSGA